MLYGIPASFSLRVNHYTLIPAGILSLSATGKPRVDFLPITLSPTDAALGLTGGLPFRTLSSPNLVSQSGGLVVSGQIPIKTAATVKSPNSGALSLLGNVPIVTVLSTSPNLIPSAGSLVLAGQTPLRLLNITNVFLATLPNSGAIAANLSFRQLVTPLLAGASYVRVSFKAGSGTYGLAHASIGVQTTTYNTAATPVELLFGGVSGFSIGSGATTVSDWVPLNFLSSDKLVVIGDAGAAGGAEAFANSGVTGCTYYNLAATNSYNVASPAGAWSLQNNTDVIIKIEGAA